MPYAYKKSERIRKNTDFRIIMKGKRLSVDGLSLFYTPNKMGCVRVGISVSKKMANAVKRNRLRRQIRNCVMRTLRDQTPGFDLVFVARRELVAAGHELIMKTVKAVLERSVLRIGKQESTVS